MSQHQSSRKPRFRRQRWETCSRAASTSFAPVEGSLAVSHNSCLQLQPDADTNIDLNSHHKLGLLNEKSSVTSALQEQIMQLASTMHTDRWTVPPTAQSVSDFEMLCGDVSNARRHSNIAGDVQPAILLDVPVRDIYMNFVNDDHDDDVGLVSEKKHL